MGLRCGVATLAGFYLAKVIAELELLRIGDGLIAEHQHSKFIHALLDKSHLFSIQRQTKVNTRHFTGQSRSHLLDIHGHARTLLETASYFALSERLISTF